MYGQAGEATGGTYTDGVDLSSISGHLIAGGSSYNEICGLAILDEDLRANGC